MRQNHFILIVCPDLKQALIISNLLISFALLKFQDAGPYNG